MSGICGVIDLAGRQAPDQTIIGKMIRKLNHRGPDQVDTVVKDHVAMGMAGLGIIDVEGGVQPLWNESKSILMVCNGRIYNYQEIQQDLIGRGHTFATKCDTEVLIHLYEQYGYSLIDHINGQFAFLIYDFNNHTFVAFRDHLGVCPFFYTFINEQFAFASEIKALLEIPGISREINLKALDQILTFPGIMSPYTFVEGIHSLPNGYRLTIDEGRPCLYEYWDLLYPKEGELAYGRSEGHYIEELEDLLDKAIRYRLQSDVPIGFYISGGIDSALVASKVVGMDPRADWKSFSLVFDNPSISEQQFQREMANALKTIHQEVYFHDSDIHKLLSQAVYHSETPLKETYNTASLALSDMLRKQGIKVVLSGEGADELFAGYVGYRFDQLRKKKPDAYTGDAYAGDARELAIRKRLWGDESFFYEKDYTKNEMEKNALYSRSIREKYNEINCLRESPINNERIQGIDIVHKRSYLDYKLRLSDHLLSDHGDRMAYANSVEGRYPFLDIDLVKYATQIPPGLKLNNYKEKYLIKKMAAGKVPDSIINRSKCAFVAPGMDTVLKQNIYYVDDILSYDKVKGQGCFDPDYVETLKANYLKEGFRLNLPYDTDQLIVVLTTMLLVETFGLTCSI